MRRGGGGGVSSAVEAADGVAKADRAADRRLPYHHDTGGGYGDDGGDHQARKKTYEDDRRRDSELDRLFEETYGRGPDDDGDDDDFEELQTTKEDHRYRQRRRHTDTDDDNIPASQHTGEPAAPHPKRLRCSDEVDPVRDRQDNTSNHYNLSVAQTCAPWHNVIERLASRVSRPFLISEVVPVQGDVACERVLSRIREQLLRIKKYRPGDDSFVLVCRHTTDNPQWEHLHILHTCSFQRSACRCSVRKHYGEAVKHRHIVRCCQLEKEDWIRIVQYLYAEERTVLLLVVGDDHWVSPPEIRLVSDGQDTVNTTARMVAQCHGSGESGAGGGQPDDVSVPEHGNGRHRPAGRRKPKRVALPDLVQFIVNYNMSPPERLLSSSFWLDSTVTEELDDSDRVVRLALRKVKHIYNSFDVLDFMSHFNIHPPLFNASSKAEYDIMYYDAVDSVYALVGLLLYQFDFDVPRMKMFLNILYRICNKDLNKCNTLYILGPPNSGKNYFFDALASFFLNSGYIISPNRNERFPFMGGLARRINIWNEARLDPYYYEDIKQIMAGDQLEVQVKNHPPRILEKTPLIVLSNREVFPSDRAFLIRMRKFEWRTCGFLARCRRKPNPVSVGLLMCWGAGIKTLKDGTNVRYRYIEKSIEIFNKDKNKLL